LPDHLKREVTVVEPTGPTEGLKVTCREVTEILDYTPGRLFVRRYERLKYGAPGGEGVLVADLPEQPLPKSSCSAALLAHVIASKYVDSMPLYRQLEGFKRQGVTLAAATVSGWVEGASQLLEPLYKELKSQVLATQYLQVDETRLQVLDHEKKGKSHRGWLWAYHAVQENLVLFDYAPGRDKDPPIKMLQSFQGHLQTDAYGAYDSFSKVPGITMAACWAHARRDFFEAAESNRLLSEEALARIGMLYTLEREWAGFSPEERARWRAEKALPILEDLHTWLLELAARRDVLPQSPIGKAVAYSLNRWDKLCAYAHTGHVKIDSNGVENAIRIISIGYAKQLIM